MSAIVSVDMRVRRKPEAGTELSEAGQLVLDRTLLALQSAPGRREGVTEVLLVAFGNGQSREQLLDDGTAEPSVEELLDVEDGRFVRHGVHTVARRRALRIEQPLLLVIAQRPGADPGPGRQLADSHRAIIADESRPRSTLLREIGLLLRPSRLGGPSRDSTGRRPAPSHTGPPSAVQR